MVRPFLILEMIGTHTARLKLPKTMKCYNVFHLSLLELYHANEIEGHLETQPEPVEVDGNEEFEVEQIL